MPNFTQKHLSLVLSAVAVVIVAGIAFVSYKAQTHSNLAASTNSSTTSGSSVPGASGKSTATSGAGSGGATGSGTNSQAAGSSASGSGTSASAPQALYFSPTGTSLTAGQTLTVQIRENSSTNPVNAVQANLSYPTDKLKFDHIDAGTSAFSIAAPSSGASGKVSIARGSTTPLSGDQLIATVSFTVLPGHGNATLAFTSGSALVTSTDHKNLVSTLGNATYKLQ